MKKSDQINRKFIETYDLSDWEIETDSGWQEITSLNKTVDYEVWEIVTDVGTVLTGADTHILIDKDNNEVFIKDSLGVVIKSRTGYEKVVAVNNLEYNETMYDVSVNSVDHVYYTNGLLSHNTTCAAGYLLWYSMFNDDSTTLIASYKYESAQEIMIRVRFAYESIPDHIRAGVTTYNKKSLEFDNGSRIVAATTTANTGRGMSLSLVYLDEFSSVEPGIAREFWTSLSPALSTGGKCIITSTPNTDEDQFAIIWHGATNVFDDFGNEKDVGKNGFKSYKAIWSAHPDRDQAWADQELVSLGEDRFAREHECCAQDTIITLKDENGQTFNITMGEFFNICKNQDKNCI